MKPPEPSATISVIAVSLHFDGLHRRARENDPQALYDLALHYFNDAPPQDIPRALGFLERAAKAEHVPALLLTAQQYESGQHRAADTSKALHYYLRASDAGDGGASFLMGAAFELGRFGQARNFEAARRFYLKAAQGGHAAAAYRLGLFYLNGYGVRSSLTNAGAWFAIAARLDHTAARQALLRIKTRLSPEQKDKVSAHLNRWENLRSA